MDFDGVAGFGAADGDGGRDNIPVDIAGDVVGSYVSLRVEVRFQVRRKWRKRIYSQLGCWMGAFECRLGNLERHR